MLPASLSTGPTQSCRTSRGSWGCSACAAAPGSKNVVGGGSEVISEAQGTAGRGWGRCQGCPTRSLVLLPPRSPTWSCLALDALRVRDRSRVVTADAPLSQRPGAGTRRCRAPPAPAAQRPLGRFCASALSTGWDGVPYI